MVLNPKALEEEGAKKVARHKRRRKMTAKQLRFFGTRAQRAAHGGRVGRKRRHRNVRDVRDFGARKGLRKMKRKKNPRNHVVHRRLRRRNPIGMGFLGQTLAPAAIGAAGAIAVDFLSSYLPLPASLQGPTMTPITKIGLALGVGLAVDMVAGSRAGGEAAAGGIIVAIYSWASQQLAGLPYGAMSAQGYGMQRYMGFIKRNRPLQLVNQRRAMAGLPPVGPFGLQPRGIAPGLGAGPHNVTKFRVRRATGQTGMGYIGPAPSVRMGRYMNGRNG
jgi:hypothetical protein